MLANLQKLTTVLAVFLLTFGVNNTLTAQYVIEANLSYSKGVAFLKRGKEAKSISKFKSVLKAEPNHDAACLLLIKLYLAKDNRSQAAVYIQHLAQIKATSKKRMVERDYYIAFGNVLDGKFDVARQQIESVITDIHRYKILDFNLLARSYNVLGYLDIAEDQSEGTQKNRAAVSERSLHNAHFLFEEALRYKPNSAIAATNYNRVNTALRIQARKIEPYEVGSFDIPESALAFSVKKDYISTAEVQTKEEWLPAKVRWVVQDFSNYDEIIFMMDASGSMRVASEIEAGVSRFNWMKNLTYHLLNNIQSRTAIGVLAVGGECGDQPPLQLATNFTRTQLAQGIKALKADGHTPVNRAMEIAPDLFGKRAKKKAILFITDGMESCEPDLTCERSAQLGQLGIELHILSFLDQQTARDEYISYTCMAETTGGSLKGIDRNGEVEKRDFQYMMEEQLIVPLLEKKEGKKDGVAMTW